MSFVPATIAAVSGVSEDDSGLASGLINTTQQIGGALGLAILATIANSRTEDVAATAGSQAAALTEGFQVAFIGAAVLVFVRDGRGRGDDAAHRRAGGGRAGRGLTPALAAGRFRGRRHGAALPGLYAASRGSLQARQPAALGRSQAARDRRAAAQQLPRDRQGGLGQPRPARLRLAASSTRAAATAARSARRACATGRSRARTSATSACGCCA